MRFNLSRKLERRLRRYRGCMRCEWCSKWTQIKPREADSWAELPFDKWVEFVLKRPDWHCRRPKCIKAREDCGVS